MNYAIILILIANIVKGGEEPDSPKTSEPNDRGLPTKVSNTEVTVVHNDRLREECNNVRPLIQYDKVFCHEQCIHVAEDCKLASDPVQCVAKLKNKSAERNLFFKKCKFADSFQELVDNKSNNYTNKCFLTKSVYKDSWVDAVNKSCHCALVNAEPCSEDEIVNSEATLEELSNLAICPRFDHEKFRIDNKSIFSIAIAGGKRIHCPKMWMLANNSPDRPNRPMKGVDLEISKVDDSELGKFCQHGPVYSTHSTQSSSKGWHYSCDDVKAVDTKWKNSCQEMCRKVDRHCSKFDSQLIECLKQRLTKGEEQRLFTKYHCYFPEEYCGINLNDTKQDCMNEIFEGKDEKKESYKDEEITKMMETFKTNCKFKRNNLGKGYMFCKLKKRNCEYTTWSKWSKCSSHCIDYDNIPIRYRKRRVKGNPDCLEERIGTIEFQICSNLPTCRYRQWITKSFSESEVIGNFDKIKGASEERNQHKWITTALNMHPEIMRSKYNVRLENQDEVEDGERYVIKKAVIVTTFEQTECSCPKGYKEISFATFIKSNNLKEQLEQLCRSDVYSQLVFDSRGRYVFYCNIGLVIKEVEKATCDDPDSKEYVACRKEESYLDKIEEKKVIILVKGMVGLGAMLGTLVIALKNTNLESGSSTGYIAYSHPTKRFMSHAHGRDDHHGHGDHHHEEPPHYAYRGDGLPSVKCEELQSMLHMNERLKTKLSNRPAVHPSESHLETSEKVDPETMEVYTELQLLYNKVLAANWHDTVQLTMNMDIWVSNLDKLRRRGRDLPHVQVQALLSETLKLFDLVYQVEDLQDHLYELMEELTAGPDSEADHAQNAVSNLKDHLGEVLNRYQEMKRLYPEYTVKLKESIGYTLAVLRQRYTFDWPEEHSYFY
ncbi:hypothetical protein MACJ_001476 [Theileria orientalis]|uniref:DUF6827 domain-containing protein n=1 Tax=Theileria orientalis TaxID=68886 RepID=A0A976M8L9_THEOR|nr:hypothetical protein MACJ_001476 [Theileria orientalis]